MPVDVTVTNPDSTSATLVGGFTYGALPWTPAEITTALWLDAADSDTITLDGSDNVEQWNDKSGNARHYTESDSARRPTPETVTGIGSVLRFDDSHLRRAAWFSLGSIAMYILARYRTTDGSNRFLFAARNSGSGSSQRLYHYASSTNFNWDVGGSPRTILTDPSDTDWHLFGNQSLSGTHSAYLDAVLVDSTTNGDTSTPVWSAIGALPGTSGAVVDATSRAPVDVCEIVAVSSGANREEIEGYMLWRRGLEALLPVGHPYKSAAPVITP